MAEFLQLGNTYLDVAPVEAVTFQAHLSKTT